MIRFESVTKHYLYDAYPVLDGLSFSLPEEPFSTLLMSSQSGKTTVAKLITGVEKPTSGKIFLRGRNIAEIKPKERNIAYFPKKPLFFARGTLRTSRPKRGTLLLFPRPRCCFLIRRLLKTLLTPF